MNLFQRWKQTTVANKALVISSFLMAFGTLFYAGAASVQVWIMKRNAHDASVQAEKLIIAAQTQASAARQNAEAADRFSTSAANINTGIGTAGQKLDLQADELDASVKQAARLAAAAEKANASVISSERPWMGATLTVDGFAAGKTPTYAVTFINSGKRPARVTLTQTQSGDVDYGDNPVYKAYDTTPSVTVVVPGQAVGAAWKDDQALMNPIGDELMKALISGTVPFRIYAKIEYTDIRTDAQYWTHACWRYTPTHTAIGSGFSSCTEYNDAR